MKKGNLFCSTYVLLTSLLLLFSSPVKLVAQCVEITNVVLTQVGYSGSAPDYTCEYTLDVSLIASGNGSVIGRQVMFNINGTEICFSGNNFGTFDVGSCSSNGNPGSGSYNLTSGTFSAPCGGENFGVSATDNGGTCAIQGTVPTAPTSIQASGVMPVKLRDFSGFINDGVVVLTWSTSGEYGFDKFEVEFSSDAKSFERIGVVNSNVLRAYSFEQHKKGNDVNYYRLKILNLDGSFSYSKIIGIRLDNSGIRVYPNPSLNGKINVYGADEQELKLFSTDGREIFFSTLRKENFLELSPTGESNGILILKNNKGDSKKIILN